MIGAWSEGSSGFLVAIALFALATLGLPLLLVPLTWARWLRWEIPAQAHLAIYFGRCLGAVVCVLSAAGVYVAQTPALQPVFFAILLGNFGLMVLVHAWGAVRRIQPITETVETLGWLLLFVVGLLFYPAAAVS